MTLTLCFLISAAYMAQPVGAQADSESNSFRGSSSADEQWTPVTSAEGQEFADPQAERDFLLEVESALGDSFSKPQPKVIEDITKSLRPMFESLDKNEYGKLGHTAVRYALHRLFVSRHGWLMKGLDPAGQRFDSASPVEVLEGKASLHVRGIFEMRLAARGFGLHELAVFASLLENQIALETFDRLNALYQKSGLTPDIKLPEKDADHLMDLYMTAYILGLDVKVVAVEELRANEQDMPNLYNSWRQLQKLLREVRLEALGAKDLYSLADIGGVLVKTGERFGQWQNAECQDMKHRLVNLEDDEKGCVPLSSFYKGAASTNLVDWQFGESLDYLKTNGIIDESNPNSMKVMVANYLQSPANCIASSNYYAVCCIDECEALLGHIERQIGGSTVAPDRLIALVGALPSSTVAGNRTLPPSQLHRLHKIAEQHGGRVPIHGRLFMQWMHMVYPRECAYPHVSGTSKPTDADDWEETGKQSSATVLEMQKFVNAPAPTTDSGQGQCGRWVDEEELYVGGPVTQRRNLAELETDFHTWAAASAVAILCIFSAATVAMIAAFKSVKHRLFSGIQPASPQLMLV